jgi:iron uptake system EfeUOB component EfeO/EfeM
LRKSAVTLLAALLVVALALVGCSSSASKKTSVADGAKKMLSELTELKQDITKNDAPKAKEHGNEVHEAWETFEDTVKDQDKKLYEEIEEPLSAIVAGTKDGKSLDAKVLTEQITKLEGLLGKLK